jgi:hypothetical protein
MIGVTKKTKQVFARSLQSGRCAKTCLVWASLALAKHGYPRLAEAIGLLLTPASLERFHGAPKFIVLAAPVPVAFILFAGSLPWFTV